ncbi:signal recognition particle 14 kDa protein isoform X2 [Numida meleagris]|uniref:signal recognition particle 14 kDa protein isoform X2 n=1 Tax=Numida meleagris TaxID=8996 RepID=UPI000B3DBDC1|nr:signal recognition particle 14 kDa protein isoform X2 [Numida meleagris]
MSGDGVKRCWFKSVAVLPVCASEDTAVRQGVWQGQHDDGRTKPVPRKGHVESFEPADNKCLLRATDGKKKISTVVSSKEVNKFQMAYSNLLRANMDGLKKKDKKSKNKKSKATQ